jgi:hypothetical protein
LQLRLATNRSDDRSRVVFSSSGLTATLLLSLFVTQHWLIPCDERAWVVEADGILDRRYSKEERSRACASPPDGVED